MLIYQQNSKLYSFYNKKDMQACNKVQLSLKRVIVFLWDFHLHKINVCVNYWVTVQLTGHGIQWKCWHFMMEFN